MKTCIKKLAGLLFALAAVAQLHAQPASSVTVTYPNNNSQTFSSNITVTGTAHSTGASMAVYVSLNNGAYQAASVTNYPALHIVKWGLAENLVAGTNIVSAYSFAGTGSNLSPVVTHKFFYAKPTTVNVTVNGYGAVTATNLFNRVTATSLMGTNFFIGRNYTLTATASHQNLFAGWANNTDNTAFASNKYTFTVEPNLSLTANFVTNEFIGAAGSYYGLFADPVNGASVTSAGWFKVTFTPGDSRQAFTLSLFVDGDALKASGAFDPGTATANVVVARKGKAPLTVSLQLNFDDTISGTVSDLTDGWNSTLWGTRSVANPSPYTGTYNLLIPGFTDPTAGPAGYGYVTVKVAVNGTVTAAGMLADGQVFSPQPAVVTTNGDWPVYAKLYKYGFDTGSNIVVSYEGAVGGWLNFGGGEPSGNLYWIKNGWTNGYYNGGFSNGVAVIGSAYASPSLGMLIPDGLMTLTGGDLTTNVLNNVSVSNAVSGAVVKIIGKTNRLQKLVFTPASGMVSGTFTNPIVRQVETFKGLYLPDQNIMGGYFLGTDQGGSLLVTLSADQFSRTTNNGAITITGYTGPGGAVTIPGTINGLPVTGIGVRAFWNCHSLTGVVIPNTVTSLALNAFGYCTSLMSVTIPNSVTSIGSGAFEECPNLVSVTVGTGVTSVASDAFYVCPNLSGVFFQGNVPASVGTSVFTGDNSTTVFYQRGTAGWSSTFAGRPTVMLGTTSDGMALVPAGAFTMGDALDGVTNAIPGVSVSVSGFDMDTNLVSYGQWQPVYNWATIMGYVFDNAGAGPAANDPVQTVNWYDTVKWCNARSQLAGLTPVYYTDAGLTQVYVSGDVDAVYVNWAANGYRLPTEAEWEKAARGGLAKQRFPWGNIISGSLANYYGNEKISFDLGPNGFNAAGIGNGLPPFTSPVGSFAANGYGLSDMAGNVFEWCWDWYGTGLNGKDDYTANSTDPRGPAAGSVRVMRGGSWDYTADYARCAARSYNSPGGVFNGNIGFRCVRMP